MKNIFNNKFKVAGLVTAFVLLFGLAFLAGTVSNSRNAALAQSTTTTPGQTTTTVTPQPATPNQSPAANPPPNDVNETADGPEGTEKAGGTQSDSDNQAALQAQAKITVEQAKQAALAKVPGTVVSATLEDENGKAVFNVVVTATAGGANQEVKINATDGTLLKVEAGGEQGDESGSQD